MSNCIRVAADAFDVATGPQKQFFEAYVVNFFKPCWTLPPPLPRVTGRHPGAPLWRPVVPESKVKDSRMMIFGKDATGRILIFIENFDA